MKILSHFGKPMKGFGVGDIGPISLALGTGALVLAVVVMILATVKSNVTDSNATAVLNKIITALATLADWYPIIVVVVAAVIILGLIVYFGQKTGAGGSA
jgi:hypothetical protein